MSIDLAPFWESAETTHMQLKLAVMKARLELLQRQWKLLMFEGDTEGMEAVHRDQQRLLQASASLLLEVDDRAHQNALQRVAGLKYAPVDAAQEVRDLLQRLEDATLTIVELQGEVARLRGEPLWDGPPAHQAGE